MAYTIDDIIRRSKETGYHFFDKDAMKFFRCKVDPEVYEGPGGIFFVTSEQFEGTDGHKEPRKWTPRKFIWESGRMAHFMGEPEFNTCTKAQAHKIARESAMRVVSHKEHSDALGYNCTAAHIAPSGDCLNCGWTPR